MPDNQGGETKQEYKSSVAYLQKLLNMANLTTGCQPLTLKHRLLRESTSLSTQGRPVFQVPLIRSSLSGGRFPVLEMGKALSQTRCNEKVILVIGATGAGKTTLINSLINYVLGVNFEDEFRFKLVSEALNGDQSRSQTQNLQVYILHHQDGFQVPYTLTIIDTPGFGDTVGIHRDTERADELYDFFKSNTGLVDHIDAVGFVAPASLPRLTPTQRYIFDSILSLFGKDLAANIFLLLTFADGKPPQIMAAIKAANLPHQTFLKFNNSAVFDDIGITTAPGADQDVNGLVHDNEDDFDEMFWKLGMKSFKKFTKRIGRIKSNNLVSTKAVLEQRGKIKLHTDELHKHVSLSLSILEQLILHEQSLKIHEQQTEACKYFTYEEWESEVVSTAIPGAQDNAICVQCNYICHTNCWESAGINKASCSSMDNGNPRRCRVCPSRCLATVHSSTRYHNVTRQVKKTNTVYDLKNKYDYAQRQHLSVQQDIQACKKDLESRLGPITNAIREIRRSLSVLPTIALKHNPFFTVEYIDLLEKSERQAAKPGWQSRLTELTALRKHAELLGAIFQGNFDPFRDYRGKVDAPLVTSVNFNHI